MKRTIDQKLVIYRKQAESGNEEIFVTHNGCMICCGPCANLCCDESGCGGFCDDCGCNCCGVRDYR
jgi:hypothetical protein